MLSVYVKSTPTSSVSIDANGRGSITVKPFLYVILSLEVTFVARGVSMELALFDVICVRNYALLESTKRIIAREGRHTYNARHNNRDLNRQ